MSYKSVGSEAGLIFGSETMLPSLSNSVSLQSHPAFFRVRCATCRPLVYNVFNLSNL